MNRLTEYGAVVTSTERHRVDECPMNGEGYVG